jgi:glucose/arabinose dehydrogenase
MMKKLKYIAASLMLMIFASEGLVAQTSIALQPFVISGLSAPVFMTSPPVPLAGRRRNRFFIVQQGGIIRLADARRGAPIVFMDITTRVLSGGERGLLGLAFHPDYDNNGRFFVYYTRQTDGAIQISEFQTSAVNPDMGDPTSEKPIITIPHPSFGNHNGGTVAFGPDGYLYAGPGDGGSGNDPSNNAQNINQLLGKIIRIDINNPPPLPAPQYNIPPDNPFAGAIPGADEIYAVGMRNPYRFSFDSGGTNQLWVADVGQGAWEEVDIVVNGGNYGWRLYEGNQCTGLGTCTFPPNYVGPIFQYSLSGPRCAVIGGYVYRGTVGTFPQGSYVYGDYCTGEIFLYNNDPGSQPRLLLDTTRNITGFAQDEAGEIYVIGQTGTIEKIIPAAPALDGEASIDGSSSTEMLRVAGVYSEAPMEKLLLDPLGN